MVFTQRFAYRIPGPNGYEIPVFSYAAETHDRLLLCLRGFGGGLRSGVIDTLAETLGRDGFGVVTFDWPAHGESEAADGALTVENCLRDLDAVLADLHRRSPLPVYGFATSFGGYLAALYRAGHPDAFEKLLLRSPALCMPQTFLDFLSGEERERFLAGEPMSFGFERVMRLGVSFYRSLLAHDAFGAPVPAPARVRILQGDCDDVVRPEDTAAYAAKNGIRVEWFRGSDHRYQQPGDPEKIVEAARRFYLEETKPQAPNGPQRP